MTDLSRDVGARGLTTDEIGEVLPPDVELAFAAEEMLKLGTHDGLCDFSGPRGVCPRHWAALARRRTALEAALDRWRESRG